MCVCPSPCSGAFCGWLLDLVTKDENSELFSETKRTQGLINRPHDETDGLETVLTGKQRKQQGRLIQLYNKHGYNLAIFPGGRVRGVREPHSPYAVLEFIPVGLGEVG